MKFKQQPTLSDLMQAFPNVPNDVELVEHEGAYLAASPTVNVQYRFSNHSNKWVEITKGTQGKGYTQVWINETVMNMHVILAKHWSIWEDGKQIDHADGDKSNNVKANLRSATHAENMRNKGKPLNNTSGYVGVTWYKATGKWRAQIRCNNRLIHLGLFDNIHEAYVTYCEAAMNLHGEFAKFNKELYEKCLLLID